MKILVTGANGFVGSHLIEHILKFGGDVEVVGMRRSHTSDMRHVQHIRDKRLRWVECDFTDAHSVNWVFRKEMFEKVFHLGAQSFVQKSFSAPNATMDANVMGTLNILEAVRQFDDDAMVHICSSSEVYGSNPAVPWDEETKFAPLSPYAASKCAADILGTMYHRVYGLETFVTRAFTHTGPRRGDAFFASSFAKQVALIEAGKQDVIKVGNLNSKRTMMDVRDCVAAYWKLSMNVDFGHAYNVGGKEMWGVGEVLHFMIEQAKCDVKIEQDPERMRPADVLLQVPDCSKIEKVCGWQPRIPVKETLKDLLDYWRKNV